LNIADIECQPGLQQRVLAYNIFEQVNDLYYSFSRDADAWGDIVNDVICDVYGPTTPPCLYYLFEQATNPGFYDSVSRKYENDLVQNAIKGVNGVYNPFFALTGWYTDLDVIDLDPITVPLSHLFLADDDKCEYAVNAAIAESIPASKSIFKLLEPTNRDHFRLTFDSDEEMW